MRPEQLHLAPQPERLAGLRTNYRRMTAMFFGLILLSEATMDKIAALEQRINTSPE